MFPVTLQDSELQWKIQIYYDVPSDQLLLTINDKDFLSMPYQADIIPNGPVNIDAGFIKLDGEEVNTGFSQYVDFFDRVFDGKRQPTTSIEIHYNFSTSSKEVVNSVIDVLGRTIDAEAGLNSLTIKSFYDQN